MIKNYIITALRNIKRQKFYSITSIISISFGMGIFLYMVFLFDFYKSTDSFHDNSDNLYNVIQVFKDKSGAIDKSAITPAPILKALLSEFPEIKDGTQFFPKTRMVVKFNGMKFFEDHVLFADNRFLSLFSFKLIEGNKKLALSQPYSLVISEAKARKYFGNDDPMGKTITLNNMDMIITGVIENQPPNSSITYDFFISMSTIDNLYEWADDWLVSTQATYLLLESNKDAEILESKFSEFINKYYPDNDQSPQQVYLVPLKKIFFSAEDINSYQVSIFPGVIYLLLVSGIILLMIGCFNFVSLSTARSILRSKEVGLRKILGAYQLGLILQFLIESILIALLSLPGALVIMSFIQEYIMRVTDIPAFSLWESFDKVILIFAITIIIGFLAGIYPAILLSIIQPLKSGRKNSLRPPKALLRKILVVSQFSLSIVIIVFAVVVKLQFNHLLKTDMGYNREMVYAFRIPEESKEKIGLLQNDFAKHSNVKWVSGSKFLPGAWDNTVKVSFEDLNPGETFTANIYRIDKNFPELMGMEIIQGNSFKQNQSENEIIVNKEAVRQFGWEDPIGKFIQYNGKTKEIIGVVNDFLFKDIHYKVSPAILCLDKQNINYILVKISSERESENLSEYFKNCWDKHIKDSPIEQIKLNDHFYDTYKGINTISSLCGFVGIIGIIFSCLGIFAIATYTVERRLQEIAIKKSLGASAGIILKSLLLSFLKYVVVGNLIGLPISYMISKQFVTWGFTYHIEIKLHIFLIVFFITIILAVVAVSWQVIRASRIDPVKILRYE